ncbi:MAG: hypothetical protein EB148_03515 [Actinobacteria bacterium]|nr:hypothetical protein [Actinomycetota bacterium]NCW91137.1 hypothetical protein [Acidimicrobiia bacterium]NBS36637.1 hypothetical protein [Actinomycetota bacterium]NCV09405.1 hypothetical protein [Actinomycetota bacterium]NCX17865.1 hypothetical protein [Acidimicrobiia bacterium]
MMRKKEGRLGVCVRRARRTASKALDPRSLTNRHRCLRWILVARWTGGLRRRSLCLALAAEAVATRLIA